MELKQGYSSYQLFPEDKNNPNHVNERQTNNYLLLRLLEPPRKPYKFAERVNRFKGKMRLN
jgi:hypothetical protein